MRFAEVSFRNYLVTWGCMAGIGIRIRFIWVMYRLECLYRESGDMTRPKNSGHVMHGRHFVSIVFVCAESGHAYLLIVLGAAVYSTVHDDRLLCI